MFESPVAIHAAVVIDEDGRVELQNSVVRVGVLLAPVAHLERSVGAVALGNQSVSSPRLVVGVEVIGLLSVGSGHEGHIGCKEHVGCTR